MLKHRQIYSPTYFLGFLNANGSPASRGSVSNYGLMDQMAVLQWVRENAEGFGGDTSRVTLFGHGTGAACVEYLAHSPTMVPGKEKDLSICLSDFERRPTTDGGRANFSI